MIHPPIFSFPRDPSEGSGPGGELLTGADPAYLRTLRRGVHFTFAAAAIGAIGFIAGFASVLVLEPGSTIVFDLSGLLMNLTLLAGTWMLTARDPSGAGEGQYGGYRKIVRGTCLVAMLPSVIALAPPASTSAPGVRLTAEFLIFLGRMIAILGLLTYMMYLERLAARIPDLPLAGHATRLKIPFVASYAIFTTVNAMAQFFGGAGGGQITPANTAYGCFNVLTGLLLLGCGVAWLILLARMARRFGDLADAAADPPDGRPSSGVRIIS